jgi:GNAT superfamily N-acetyltransferase
VLRVELLSRAHDRTGFNCGTPALNLFLRTIARQHGEKGVSRTLVLVDSDKPADIIGFFTLTLCEVEAASLSFSKESHYPQHKLPAVRLARLAVSKTYQNKGNGGILLAEAVSRTLIIADHAGSIGLFVDAKSRDAADFYKHFGFVHLPGQHNKLFLPLKTLRAAQANK